MELTRQYLPNEWEYVWRREKERRRRIREEKGKTLESENRRYQWIKDYNDKKAMKNKEKMEKMERHSNEEVMEENECEQRDQQEVMKLKCNKDTYPTDIFQTLEEMRQRCVLTDLILKVEKGLHLRAHSLVLAAVSDLIQQMLHKKNGLKRSDMVVCPGPKVSASGLSAVLEFAYTGAIAGLSKNSVSQIQTAAQYLKVPRVLELCEEEVERERRRVEGKKVEEEMMISAEEQLEASLQSIRQLWAAGTGCDVELQAGGQAFSAHRVLLAASSDYFCGMFTSGMKESRQASVLLHLIDSRELEALLHCCYSGDLVFDWDCIFELTCSSLQFQLQPALSLCLNFLEQNINIHSCLDIIAFAEAYMMIDLLEAAEDFVLVHFQEVSTTPKFQDLSVKKLLYFLTRDNLYVSSELAVFKAVVTWLEAELEERLPKAKKLMAGVRFPLMTYGEFTEVRAANLQMECSSERSIELYSSALKDFGFGVSTRKVQHRIRHPKDTLVVVGGDQQANGLRVPSRELWFLNSLHSCTGMVKKIEWRILGKLPEQPRFKHGVAVLDGKLYVAGGCYYYAYRNTMKSVYRYDPLEDSWERLADMKENRSNFMMVVRGDYLYAIGGDRDINNNLDTVEKYSQHMDTWSFTHPLDQPLSGHAAIVWGGEIFISGGFNCKYQCLVSMLLYHPERGTTYLAEMPHDRALHCVENMGNCIYVFGGVSNLLKFYTDQLACEIYNPTTDSWAEFSPLPLAHVGGASAVLEERIYILGGYCQEDYTESRRVHRYDALTQHWDTAGIIEGPVTDIKACLLHLPADLRK